MNHYQWIADIAAKLNINTIEFEDRLLKAYHLMPEHQLSMYVRMLESGIPDESAWTRDDHNLVYSQFAGWRMKALVDVFMHHGTWGGPIQ